NDDFRVRIALQLDDHACIFIRLVANGADFCQHFFVHQRRDAFDEGGAIDVVWNFSDDNLFPAAFELLAPGLAAHFHTAATSLEILFDSRHAADRTTGWKIRALHVLHQLVERDVWIVDLRADSVDHLAQIVRRDIGGHADGDPGSAVNEQIRKRSWKNCRLGARLVVIRDKIDRVLLHVGHERSAEMRHACFGITHGSRRIAFHRSKIALPIDQPLAHRPGLRHVDESGVNHCFAVRMIITARVAADFCAFAMLSPRKEREIMHGKENPTLRWFESVACVRQCARNNDGHRVIEERSRYFVSYIYRLYFFVWIKHDWSSQRRSSRRRDALRGSALPRCAKSRLLAGWLEGDQSARRALVKFAK